MTSDDNPIVVSLPVIPPNDTGHVLAICTATLGNAVALVSMSCFSSNRMKMLSDQTSK